MRCILGAGTRAPWGDEPFLPQVSDSDEKSHHQAVMEAMQVIGFRAEEVGSVHRILAAILHLVSLAAQLGATAHMLSPTTRGGGGWPLTAQPPSWPLLPLLKPSRFCCGLPGDWAQNVAGQACEVPSRCLEDEPALGRQGSWGQKAWHQQAGLLLLSLTTCVALGR